MDEQHTEQSAAQLSGAGPVAQGRVSDGGRQGASPVPTPTPTPPKAVAGGLAMKRRNPVGAWLGLPLITLGIYHFVWYFKIHNEMLQFDRRRYISPVGSMLVILLLGWTVVAPLISFYNTGKRIANAQRAAGMEATCSAGLGLLLCFVFGLQVLYYQTELNKVVDRYQAPGGTQVPLFA
jgi:hypothetical protein